MAQKCGSMRHKVLVKLECDFDLDDRWDSLAVGADCRLKDPFIPDFFDGFFVQAHSDALHHTDITSATVWHYYHLQNDHACESGLAALFRVVRARTHDAGRRTHAIFTGTVSATASSTTGTGTKPSAASATDPSARACAHAAAGAGAIRVSDHFGQRVSPAIHIRAGDAQAVRSNQSWLHLKLRIGISDQLRG